MVPSPRKTDLPNSRNTTPSNTGRRRTALPANADVTPGHVAQMQRLFQSAKASLRMDMAFAASPTGSIGSRLPPTWEASTVTHVLDMPSVEVDSTKSWRYSTAPGILLGLDRDVREPVPEASPTLPDLPLLGPELDQTPEPLSSGFNSPLDQHQPAESHESGAVYGSSPPLRSSNLHMYDKTHDSTSLLGPQEPTLEGQMTCLRVASDDEQLDLEMDDSPVVAHVRKISAADIPLPASRPMSTEVEDVTMLTDTIITEAIPDEEIFLSEPAKAAAESAKARRGILKSIFSHHRRRGKRAEDHQNEAPDSPSPTKAEVNCAQTPCPDPKLHELFSRTTCPNPSAHMTPHMQGMPTVSITPEAVMALAQGSPAALNLGQIPPTTMYSALHPPMLPHQRATATGSPMAFPKFKSPPPSPPRPSAHSDYLNRPSGRPFSPPPPRTQNQSESPDLRGEHFQPGWYYTRVRPGPTSQHYPMAYCFSTAAAKSAGQSAAPDSRIRDSYRTDTLTPLAKPPSRYRKTGIAAMASARGVSKYYADVDGRAAGQVTRTGTGRPYHRSGVRFRSSPPPQPVDMAPGLHKRRRPKDLEDENFEVREDDSQVMELDDDTQAAIRMSLFGSETPEMLHARESLRELSPNIVTARKDRRQRKKRRPSYWDGDLKEVQNSPARRSTGAKVEMADVGGSVREGAERKVMTSPPKESVESLRSQRVEIEGKENMSVRNSVQESFSYTAGDDDMLMTESEDCTLMAIEREMN